MVKTILVTGASGFTGRHLLNRLKGTEYEIIPFVRSKSGIKNEIVADFNSTNFLQLLNDLSHVDHIIHLGAKIGWEGGTREELFIPNVLATTYLSLFAKENDSSLIFSSAAIVCGAKNKHINSNSPLNPDTYYGHSKWLAEECIRMSGVEHCILRIGGIYGYNGPRHLGINRALNGAMSGQIPELYGSGQILRNYIYVEDLVDNIIHCVANNIVGTHFVAGPEGISMIEMLEIICNQFLPGKHPKILEGNEGHDQLIEHSSDLLEPRLFLESIEHISELHRNEHT